MRSMLGSPPGFEDTVACELLEGFWRGTLGTGSTPENPNASRAKSEIICPELGGNNTNNAHKGGRALK